MFQSWIMFAVCISSIIYWQLHSTFYLFCSFNFSWLKLTDVDTMSANNFLSITTTARETTSPPKTVTSPREPLTTVEEYCNDVESTSLDSNVDSQMWLHRSHSTTAHSTFAAFFPQDLSMSTLFPYPVYSLTPPNYRQRRAIDSWNMNSLTQTGSDLLNTATLSLINQHLLSRLPWQSPVGCSQQPEIPRRDCDDVLGGRSLAQSLQRAASRRVSPVNWLLSDDVSVTSTRKWNSPGERCRASDAGRDVDRALTSTSRSSVPCAASVVGVASDRKLTCRHCSKPYASLGALKMHIRTHTLPCRCQLCGKAFSRPWLLQGHLRTHTGERPFACPQCGRAFADRSNLRAHLQTHAELKKYACDRCTKTFSRLSLLVKHRNGPAVCGVATSSPWKP